MSSDNEVFVSQLPNLDGVGIGQLLDDLAIRAPAERVTQRVLKQGRLLQIGDSQSEETAMEARKQQAEEV